MATCYVLRLLRQEAASSLYLQGQNHAIKCIRFLDIYFEQGGTNFDVQDEVKPSLTNLVGTSMRLLRLQHHNACRPFFLMHGSSNFIRRLTELLVKTLNTAVNRLNINQNVFVWLTIQFYKRCVYVSSRHTFLLTYVTNSLSSYLCNICHSVSDSWQRTR